MEQSIWGENMKKKKSYCIVKRGTGKCEKYDERKVYGSVYAACYVVLMNEHACEKVANAIASKITKLVRVKKQIPSHHISRFVTKELQKHNVHAAFMYETHRDIG